MNQSPDTQDNPLIPANLSPLPRTPLACSLPYDLTWDDLRLHLPGFDEHAQSQAQAFETYQKQGLHGGPNSCILSLRYPTTDNETRLETVFVKQTADPWKVEAQKYHYLASQDVPTPRLIAAIYKDDTEIILLEFLPVIGIDFHSPRQVNDLLHLAAQVNSILNPPDFFISAPGLPDDEFDEGVRNVLQELSHNRALPFTLDVVKWFDAYRFVENACRSMPLALNHGQYSFQQVGWAPREPSPQLVTFDLETMSLWPRFFDIAGILTPLANYTGQDQHQLFKIYFDRLCQLIQLDLDLNAAYHEQKLIGILDAFQTLPWLLHIKDSEIPGLIDTSLTKAGIDLYHNLTSLKLV